MFKHDLGTSGMCSAVVREVVLVVYLGGTYDVYSVLRFGINGYAIFVERKLSFERQKLRKHCECSACVFCTSGNVGFAERKHL